QAFLRFQRPVAQILLAPEDISNRHKYLNARNTLETLLDLGVVPIVNENDTVAIEELKFGDNDRLSALVASLVDAQLLIILSDVDGLFSADPKKDPTATLIPEVPRVSSDIESMAGGEGTTVSTGGMKSKVLAARIASISGAGVILASGKDFGILHRIMHGETVGTFFYPQPETLKNRKRWIAFGMMIHGKIFIDFGAAEALLQNKSLLPAGIRKVTGTFDVGDCVEIMDETGCLMGRGMVNYSSTELKKIHGLHSTELRVIFPDRIFEEEVIHIDNMVLFHREEKENV
ncbi:MAG: glutamate 5-kinase, partial [Candidatus Atribacteria bacterium]|nr:glutamate 5-kinase [Candidatus Atribacteria bacterium]